MSLSIFYSAKCYTSFSDAVYVEIIIMLLMNLIHEDVLVGGE